MQSFTIDESRIEEQSASDAVRRLLRDAEVYSVNLIGGRGCGKSLLIAQTLARLRRDVSAGVVTSGSPPHCQIDRVPWLCNHTIHVRPGAGGRLDAAELLTALYRPDLLTLDLLLIENVGSLLDPPLDDIGQNLTVAVFSVTPGGDSPRTKPELVRRADVVLLNKVDMAPGAEFDLSAFNSSVRRLNANAEIFEVSALHGEGMDGWAAWLGRQVPSVKRCESSWFG